MNSIKFENYFWQNDLVRLRAWSEEDWEWDFNKSFDSDSTRFGAYEIQLPPSTSASKKDSEGIANLRTQYNRTHFAIENLEGVLVGRINILLDDHKNGTFGAGLSVEREHRGKGYASSALKIIFKYAFMEKRLNKYTVSVLEGNIASMKMHEKLACEVEGVHKQNGYTDGKYLDEIFYGLTKDTYLAMNETSE